MDILINKNVQKITKPITINELDSDHLPILVIINDTTFKRNYPNYLDYKNANWSSFRSIINKKLEINNKLTTPIHIDNTVENLTKIIQHSIKKSIFTKKSNKYCQLPEHLLDSIKIRNYHRCEFHKTRNFQH